MKDHTSLRSQASSVQTHVSREKEQTDFSLHPTTQLCKAVLLVIDT